MITYEEEINKTNQYKYVLYKIFVQYQPIQLVLKMIHLVNART